MSNRAQIYSTIFINPRMDNEKEYGVRVVDNYGGDYSDTWDSIPNDNLEILKLCVEKYVATDDDGVIDNIIRQKEGVSIDGTWYDWKEIGHILLEQDRDEFLADLKAEQKMEEDIREEQLEKDIKNELYGEER